MEFKLLKCNILIVSFLFTSFISIAQNKISGTILNSKNESLSYANVTVYNEKETSLVTYAITDENGKYSLELPKGIYFFKISFLGYKPLSIKKNIIKDEIFNFKLIEDVASLDEVVIKAKSLDALIRNDTIKYNLNKLTTGNEENLKDVLNKLPGVEIDENGKIKANGKKIDKLLIDGKEFFGDQHQLATENISAEMIKGISLLENFNDLTDIENQTHSGKTAMNIEIGENYKGQIKGNISIGGGYKNRYELNTNLFTFRKKTNLFFIGSTNNIGNQTFTFEDYISFQGGVQKFISDNTSSTTISSKDLPSYLLPNNNVESKNELFSALNFSYNPSEKFKLNSYVIFDKTSITEKQLIKQTYITNNQNVVLNIENSNDKQFLINNSFVNAVYKPSKKSVFEYVLSLSPQNNNLKSSDILTVTNYNTLIDKNSITLNQTLKFKHRFNKTILSSTIYYSYNENKENLNIISNESFLDLIFPNSNYKVLQNINNSHTNYGINTYLSRKITKKTSLKIKYILSNRKEKFISDIQNNTQHNDINFNVLENKIGFSFFNKRKSFLNYNFGSDISLLNAGEYFNTNILPFGNIKFNFNKSHNLKVSYKKNIDVPQVDNLINESYIQNYNTFITNQNIRPNTISKNDNFGVNYFIYDLFSGTLLSLGVNHIIGRNIITTNTEYTNDYITNKYFLGKTNKKTTSYLLLDKKFSKIPFNLRFKNTFSHLEDFNYINEIQNRYISNIFSNNLKLSSNFKTQIFNFDIGHKRKQSIFFSKNIETESKVILNEPYLNFNFNFNRFSITLNNSMEFYSINGLQSHFIRISPKIHYKTKDKKWKFYVKGQDILNINTNYVVENAIYDNYIEEKTLSTMAGYIIGGLTYKF